MFDSSLSPSKGRNILGIICLMLGLFPLDSLLFCHNLCPMIVHASENGDPFGLFRLVSTIRSGRLMGNSNGPVHKTRRSPRNVFVEFYFDFAIRYVSRMWSQTRIRF